jgi:hypothetical protein
MKGKNLLCLAIVMSIALAILPVALVKASPTKFWLDPPSVIGPPPNKGDTIHVVLRIDTVPDLFLWVATIEWDPAVFELVDGPDLDALANAEEGMTIKQTQPTAFMAAGYYDGKIDQLTCTSLGAGVSVPPNPTDMAHMYFKVKDYSFGTYINITFARYVDTIGTEHTPDVEPLYFELLPPTPTPPTAAFEPPTCNVYYIGDVITFNATASIGGYDGDNSTTITEYRWDFNGDLMWDDYGMVVYHSFDTVGDKNITLEVYAPGIPPYIDIRYYETDRESHVIHIIEKILIGIDVYTARNGIGAGMPSDAYGPQEEVTVFAKVTYGGEGVAYKPVAFEVKDNNGEAVLTRTVFTDMYGDCNFTFRIPWTGMEAESKFGTWTIFGSVDIAEVTYTDYCEFEFGYKVSILSVATTDALDIPKGTFLKGELVYVELQLKNICFGSKNVYITATIYDNEGVPIGFMSVPSQTVPPGTSPYWNFGIQIPYWRFKGQGTVYVDIFDKMPQNGGTPYCPEGHQVFILG